MASLEFDRTFPRGSARYEPFVRARAVPFAPDYPATARFVNNKYGRNATLIECGARARFAANSRARNRTATGWKNSRVYHVTNFCDERESDIVDAFQCAYRLYYNRWSRIHVCIHMRMWVYATYTPASAPVCTNNARRIIRHVTPLTGRSSRNRDNGNNMCEDAHTRAHRICTAAIVYASTKTAV